MMRATLALVVILSPAQLALAHHGGGTFDSSKEIELTGKLTRLDLINPHAWIYFDVTGKDGKVTPHRCEMRSATVLRRSGWTKEMFRIGQRITIQGSPDRIDPNSCYLNTIILEDGSRADRYGQFTKPTRNAANRPLRRPGGEPNISGDWAPEQLVMTDPRGRRGALVPLSTVDQYKPGEGRIGGPPPAGGGPRRYRGAELTPLGEQAAANFGMFAVKDNPRMRCETTSIIFDWTFDGPVNRITQNKDTIVLQYGQLGFTRTIHMNLARHPTGIRPSRAGHSIGRWENDILIVDTVGFAPGVLSPPVLNSDRLHVVERFSLDPKTMVLTRSYVAEDPVYLKGQYAGSDAIQVADLPYKPDPCKELGFVDYSKEARSR
jgi:hypothetical protein